MNKHDYKKARQLISDLSSKSDSSELLLSLIDHAEALETEREQLLEAIKTIMTMDHINGDLSELAYPEGKINRHFVDEHRAGQLVLAFVGYTDFPALVPTVDDVDRDEE